MSEKYTPYEQKSTKPSPVRIIETSLHKEAYRDIEKERKKLNEKKAIALSIKGLSHVFIFSEKELTEIIDRESQWDKNAVSSKWAQGIMQVRKIVLDDMRGVYDRKWQLTRGKGIDEYLEFFRKIPPSVVNRIWSYTARTSVQTIQKISPDDRVAYQKAIKTLENNLKDPHVNLIIGSIYLAFLADKTEKPADLKTIVKKVNLKAVNKLLVAKEKTPINKEKLEKFKQAVIQNPEVQKKFIMLASYNEWRVSKNMVHGHNYAAAIMLA